MKVVKSRRTAEATALDVQLDVMTGLRLERLALHLQASTADVLRLGLLALERETWAPVSHPALRLPGAEASRQATARYDATDRPDQPTTTAGGSATREDRLPLAQAANPRCRRRGR